MRLIKNYKIYTKTKNISGFPTRILKFKRTKWAFLKKKIRKIRKKILRFNKLNRIKAKAKNKFRRIRKRPYNLRLYNNRLLKVNKGSWYYLDKTYRTHVLNKRTLLIYFNNNKSICLDLKKMRNGKILNFFHKYTEKFFLTDFFLFKHRIVASVFASRELLRSRKILLNNETLKKNTLLKKGDLIQSVNSLYSFKRINRKYTRTHMWLTYSENDYYTQSIVIVKSLNDFSFNDYSLVLGSYLDFNNIN